MCVGSNNNLQTDLLFYVYLKNVVDRYRCAYPQFQRNDKYPTKPRFIRLQPPAPKLRLALSSYKNSIDNPYFITD